MVYRPKEPRRGANHRVYQLLLDAQTEREMLALAHELRTNRSAVVREAIRRMARTEGISAVPPPDASTPAAVQQDAPPLDDAPLPTGD